MLSTIEPLVSTLTERLVGAIGEHDEALAAAPIWSYTKPHAPGKLLECLGAASTKSTATQTKPVELLTMGEAQDRLADLRVEEKALEQRIEHLTQNATPIDIQQGFLRHLYEVVLASMVSTMVPDTTDDSFDGTNSVLSDHSISCPTSSPPLPPPLDSFGEYTVVSHGASSAHHVPSSDGQSAPLCDRN
jgi:hypothetical protein